MERRYFDHYFDKKPEEINDFTKEMVKHYFTGLKWITLYYFDKCPSWNWYFPYDHPPFLEDINKHKINFKDINFELGEPLHPHFTITMYITKTISIFITSIYKTTNVK